VVERVASDLAALGHRVEQAHPAALAAPDAIGHFLTGFGAWTARELDHIGTVLGRPVTADDVEAGTWATAELGRGVTAAQYIEAVEGLHRHTRAVVSWWDDDGWDLLLSPTIPEVPPTLGQFASTPENPLAGLVRATPVVAFTAVFNITGQPAVSLPLGESSHGLPVGVQLVSAPAREDVLLRVASQLEAARPWRDRQPPIHADSGS